MSMSENKIGPATEPKTKRWQLSGAFRDGLSRLKKRKQTFQKEKKTRLPEFKKEKNCDGAIKSGRGKIKPGTAEDPLGLDLE